MRAAAAGASLLLAAASLSACMATGARAAIRVEIDALAAERSVPAPSSFGLDAPGAFHVHTRLSHDSPGLLDEVIAAARATGNRWVCLTDHTNPATTSGQPRGMVGGVLVIPGEEISVWGGSLYAAGAARSIDKVRADGVKKDFFDFAPELRDVGAASIYGHILDFDSPPKMLMDGAAIYDLSADFRAMNVFRFPAILAGVGSRYPARGAEAYLLFVQSRQEKRMKYWDDWLALGPCAGLAEHDAHAKFRWFGRTWDSYAALISLVRNHALVPTVDEASVLDALRRGRVAIGFDAAADLSGARFEAFRGERPAAAMGDAIPFDPALSLVVHLPLAARVRVLRDGKPWRTGRGRVLSFPVEGPGVYRAEADVDLAGAARPWGIFNPVRVTAR